jgi:hypothetical protein
MRIASVAALLLTIAACKDSGPPAPLPPSAAFDPGWYGSAHVPQLDDPQAVYDTAGSRKVAALAASLLVCHIDVDVNPQDNSAPDLVAWLTLGKRHSVWVRAPYSNSYTATVSWPATDLLMGERISLSIYDEDTWTNDDLIASFEAKFDGTLPIVMTDDTATIECRVPEPAVVEARLRTALADADQALAALDTVAEPDLIANHRERPTDAVDAVRRSVAKAAALVGWHVPGVKSRVAREQVSEQAWKAKLVASMETLARTLPTGRATMTCDAVVIDRALPANQRPYRPATACLVTVVNPTQSTDLALYSPDGIPLRPLWYDGTSFMFEVRAVEAPAIKLARYENEVIRVR